MLVFDTNDYKTAWTDLCDREWEADAVGLGVLIDLQREMSSDLADLLQFILKLLV